MAHCTCICCSITSETSTRQGSRVRRHGRSRALFSNLEIKASWICLRCADSMPAPFAHPRSLRSLALTTSASLHKDGSLLLWARVDHKSGKWLPARFDVRGHVFGHVPIRITRSSVHHAYLRVTLAVALEDICSGLCWVRG